MRQFKPGQLQTGSLYNISASYALTSSYSLAGTGFPYSGSAVITGSLLVSGSGITGSLFGTATTASYVTGSIFTSTNPALSASYALTASYLQGYISPFPFTGSAQITGSLGVTGSITTSGSNGTINNLFIGRGNGNIPTNVSIGASTNFSGSATGGFNTAIGSGSLARLTTGTNNIAIGYRALCTNTTGAHNTAIGTNALLANTGGARNTAIGGGALCANTTGNDNTAIGCCVLRSNTTGCRNTAIGFVALCLNTTGTNNTGIGHRALQSNTTGCNNTAIGYCALVVNTTGCNNTAIGFCSLRYNTTGSYNIAIGKSTLQSNIGGCYNLAVGLSALCSNTTGYNSIAIGNGALAGNTTGNGLAIGLNALANNTTGNYNVAIGIGTLSGTTIGNSNTAIGMGALQFLQSGSSNIAFGRYAAQLHSSNAFLFNLNSSIAIGANTKPSASGDINEIIIGDSAIGLGSNTTVIGNSNTTRACIFGQLTAGGFTGSLFGTASNAVQAVSASYLNTLNQDLTFNGNLTLNGTASISYLNVSYESASVIYSSGSNQFGDAANDVQTLWGTVDVKTGPVLVTGSLNVTGSANITNQLSASLGHFATRAQIGELGTEQSSVKINGLTFNSNLKVSDLSNSNAAQTILHKHSTTAAPIVVGARSNSDTTSHGAVINDMPTLSIYGAGWTSGTYSLNGQINVGTDDTGTISGTSSPGKIEFWTTPNGTIWPEMAMKIDSNKKLTVSGSVQATSFTGSLLGTSSYATQALSASFASTVPASGVIGLNLSQIATGSVTASVSPTQFTVTSGSSTEFIVTGTGVTIGNALTDTHRITGSLGVTGSINNLFIGRGNGNIPTNISIGATTNFSSSATGTNNVAIGSGSLSRLTTGCNNTALGRLALYYNTTGTYNTAIGSSALQNNTTGQHNTALGRLALLANTTGCFNLAIGVNALRSNITGCNNTAIGKSALFYNEESNNTAIGNYALYYNTTGRSNTAIGNYALRSNSTGAYNTAIGRLALNSNTTGGSNTAIGNGALSYNTTGQYNTAIGYRALYYNTTGTYNTALGGNALFSNTVGISNTAIGVNALNANTSGSNNIAIGYRALCANTTGFSNAAIGYHALCANTTGAYNTAIGHRALFANTTGGFNTAIGKYALRSNTEGGYNTAIGYRALCANTTGFSNAAIGQYALQYNTTGAYNTAIGRLALQQNTTGRYNTAIGYRALRCNTTGGYNTAIGNGALQQNTTGRYNTAIGYNALSSNTTANNNIAFGFQSNSAIVSSSNNIVIGTNIGVAESSANKINIGGLIFGSGSYADTSSGVFSGSSNGFVGINQPNPQFNFDTSGSGRFTNGLTVTGSLNVTGSITGSLFGTSSWANNALTASFVATSSTNAFVQGGNSFGTQALLGTNDIQNLAFETSGSTRMFVSSSGLVGVRTTNPEYTFDVSGSIRANGSFVFATDGAGGNGLSFVRNSSNNWTWGSLSPGIGNVMTIAGNTIGLPQVVTTSNGLNVTPGGNQQSYALGVTVGAYPAATLATFSSGSVTALTISGSGMRGTGSFNYTGSITTNGSLTVTGSTTLTNGQTTIQGAGATSATTTLLVRNSTPTNTITVLDNGTVGIGRTPTSSLDVAGTTRISGSFNTSASGSVLTVIGSGSAQPIFTVQGSQGELFSITDSLSGSLFSVNDISGLPILEVFSDNTTLIGNYQDPMLITTAKVVQTNSGSFTMYSLPTASYDTAFFEYSVRSGSNARAGTIMAIQSGSTVNFTETTTTDFGSTSAVSFTVIVTGSNLALTGSSTSGAWTIKTIVRSI